MSILLYFHPSLKETFKYFFSVILGERPFCLFTISIHSTPLKIQFTPSHLFYKEVGNKKLTSVGLVYPERNLSRCIKPFDSELFKFQIILFV
jgi:hypothetical protein